MHRAIVTVLLALVVPPCGLACRDSSTTAPDRVTALRFEELDAATTGLDVTMRCGNDPSTQILEVKGGGIALIDYDRDGDLDVFVPNGAWLEKTNEGPGCRLFANDGELRFRDVTKAAGLGHRRWSFGVTVGDYDDDGFDDLFIACYGPNVLLRNDGAGKFEDATRRAGLGDAHWGTGCAFGDIDADGDLDLYVCNYVDFDPGRPPPPSMFKTTQVLGGPIGLAARHDVLWENRGDGTFRDASESSGCRAVRPAYALNVAIVDIDADGRQDIFVGNDSMANYLFRHLGGLRFEDVGTARGVGANADGVYQATMGIAVGDVTGNGRPDIFTTNFSGDTNTLWTQGDDGFFDEATRRFGLGQMSMAFVGWACELGDFDLDGDEDLIAFNGHVYPQATRETMDSPYLQTPLLFAREEWRFHRQGASTAGEWLAKGYRDRTAAFGDLDGDGDLDAVIGELNGPVRVLRGLASRSGSHWVIIDPRDRRGGKNRRGIGCRVDVETGGRKWRRWIRGGGPFQSANAAYAHFGLGPYAGPLRVTVLWPDGVETTLADVKVDCRLEVVRDDRREGVDSAEK